MSRSSITPRRAHSSSSHDKHAHTSHSFACGRLHARHPLRRRCDRTLSARADARPARCGGAVAIGLDLRGQMRDARSMNDPGSFRGYIEERLKLTEAQRDSLRDELGATYDDLAALRNATAEEYRELIDTFSHRV